MKYWAYFVLFTLLMTLSLLFAAYGFLVSAVGAGLAAFGVLVMYMWEKRSNE